MVFIRLFVSAFLFIPLLFGDAMKEEDYTFYLTQIVCPIAKEAQEEFDLFYIGRGGELAEGVGAVEVKFIAYRRGSLEEARKIQVTLMERLIRALNTHEKIRPFLAEYPFPVHRVSIMLAYRKGDDSCYADGSVVLSFQAKNNLCYFSEDPKTERSEIIIREPYEKAKQKVILGK